MHNTLGSKSWAEDKHDIMLINVAIKSILGLKNISIEHVQRGLMGN